jgi:hypothetical protein
MFVCKTVKSKEPRLKFYFDDFLTYEECLKVELQDVEAKLKEH